MMKSTWRSQSLSLHSGCRAGYPLIVSLGLALSIGCSSGEKRIAQSDAPVDPCAAIREQDPHCGWKPHWDDTGALTNALDGTKTEFLSLESTDADGVDNGGLHYATLKLCFKNGKACGGNSMAIAFEVHSWVRPLDDDTRYQTTVRFRFDNEPLEKQVWTIADSRDALGPPSAKVFFSQLLRHQKLILEFSYDERSPRTLTFDLPGLAEKMKSTSLSL
jgi:hypothetical protein